MANKYQENRSLSNKTEGSIPDDFDILTNNGSNGTVNASGGVEGEYSAIQVFGAAFPDDLEGCIVNGKAKNLSYLNSLPEGSVLPAFFQKLTISAGYLLAFKICSGTVSHIEV